MAGKGCPLRLGGGVPPLYIGIGGFSVFLQYGWGWPIFVVGEG